MSNKRPLIFKIADCLDEFEQIHRLNYETFVEEIPQHEENASRCLIDKFHKKNTYVTAKDGQRVIAMVCLCTKRPFSLDQKLSNLGEYLPDEEKIAEIRLLSIRKQFRKQSVFTKLMLFLYEYLTEAHITVVIASGVIRELPLYYHMGFVPFAHIVGTEKASFQPILLHLKKVGNHAQRLQEARAIKES